MLGPSVALVLGTLAGVIADDLNTAYAVFVLIAGTGLLWRKDDPPVLPFIIGLQWLSVTAGHWYASWFGTFPGYYVPGDVERTMTIALTGLLVLAVGARLTSQWAGGRGRAAEGPAVEGPDSRVWPLFVVVMACYAVDYVYTLNAREFGGIASFVQRVLEFRQVLLVTLWLEILRSRRHVFLLFVSFAWAVIPRLGTYYSDFKSPIVLMLLVLAASWRPWESRWWPRSIVALLKGAPFAAALLILLLIWQGGLKRNTRMAHDAGAIGADPSQHISFFVENFRSELPALLEHPEPYVQALVERVSYITFFSRVLEHVPDREPYAHGELLRMAMLNAFVPRLLNPDKPELPSDSVLHAPVHRHSGRGRTDVHQHRLHGRVLCGLGPGRDVRVRVRVRVLDGAHCGRRARVDGRTGPALRGDGRRPAGRGGLRAPVHQGLRGAQPERHRDAGAAVHPPAATGLADGHGARDTRQTCRRRADGSAGAMSTMPAASTRRRVLAAPMLGERGGGIGRVSELLWDAMRDTWPSSVDLVTLVGNGHVLPHVADKIRFGAALARRRLGARPAWTLFSHLGLARVEGYLPVGLRAPYAVFLHGIEAWKPLTRAEMAAVRGASLRIANSRFTARAVAAANPAVGDIVICPPALPKGMALPAPEAARARNGRTVLMVGRLSASERYKGHEQLIRAWPGVVARVPDARLVIAGEGDDAPRLARLAADSPAGGSVRFTGFLPKRALDAEYAQAALFALPSRGEGFGLVYLEAMAHGLACVGSPHDAASEVIEDGTTGVLVDPDDVATLGRRIADLLESPDRRWALGEAGRARVAEVYQYGRFRQQIVDLLRAGFPGMGGA